MSKEHYWREPSSEPPPVPQPPPPPPPPKQQTIVLRKCCHEHRAEELEAALRIIQTWAACFDSRIETADKAMDDIETKCREVLR